LEWNASSVTGTLQKATQLLFLHYSNAGTVTKKYLVEMRQLRQK